jgi:hypothetical protein
MEFGAEIFPREHQTPEALDALQKADAEKWWPIIKRAEDQGGIAITVLIAPSDKFDEQNTKSHGAPNIAYESAAFARLSDANFR